MESAVKTRPVKIGGRNFKLAFTLISMMRMQNEIEGFDFNELNEIIAKPDKMLKILYILADTGAKLSNEKLDVDEEWMALHIPASAKRLIYLRMVVIDTMTDGMLMETEEEEDLDREIDVVLQEIQKKRVKTSSPGGRS